MTDPGAVVSKTSIAEPASVAPSKAIVGGVLFGLAFGFLLQKGGVGNYHILIGQLLFQDWTVVKIMITAIVVGMVGIFTLHRFAKVNLHLKPTKLGPNIVGGLIFGFGFALIGYCPGTAASALGQGSWDAIFGMAGLVAGSWVYAEMSGSLKKTIESWGSLGKLTLFDVIPLPRSASIALVAMILIAALAGIELSTVR